MLIRYEDFVSRPRPTMDSIAELLGERPDRLPLAGEQTVRLSTNHTAGGNYRRFEAGDVELRTDDHWITRQRRTDRWLTTALALPLLGRYGYPITAGLARRNRTSELPASRAGIGGHP